MLLEEPVDMPSRDARKRQETAKKKKIKTRKKISYQKRQRTASLPKTFIP